MKADFYIHIGLHKTGTTSIQATFFQNRKLLLAHGINYLPLSENHSTTLYPLFIEEPHRYQPNRRAGIDTPRKAAKKNAATKAALRRALENNNSPKVVVSGEDLSMLPAAGLQRLKDMLAPYAERFQIIVYVREPYATVSSIFQQRLRRGQSYEQICRRPPRPGYARIAAAIEVFGRANVDIRIFDSASFVGGDLIADFLSTIDAEPNLAQQLMIERANVGLSHEAAMLLAALNQARPVNSFAERRDLVSWLAGIPGQPYRCPPQFLAAAEPLIREDLEWLHQALGKAVFPAATRAADPSNLWQEQTLTAMAQGLDDLVRVRDKRRSIAARLNAVLQRLNRPLLRS